jgi:predicted GNAT family acetyltransferase
MSTADLQNLDIVHHPIPGRFAVQVEGEQAYLDYQTAGSTMHVTHTLVPDAIAGRGIAGRLVQAALNHARHEGWKVKPLCSYADAWMARHPEYADLRA